jgi:transposase
MREERIILTPEDQRRAVVLTRVAAGEWTQAEAATTLGLSVRQVRRLVTAYRAEGPAALVHGNRGRTPAHALTDRTRAQVRELARTKYAGFNDHHLTDKLATDEQLVLSRSSVRRILRTAGLPSPRKRRAPTHRSRRERMAQEGMLLQADGSRHRWLGPDGPYLTLVGGIDDATGTVPYALFREQEDAHGYMLWLDRVVRTHGIPLALYVDRHSIHERRSYDPLTLTEELVGGGRTTQFGRVLAELDITHIPARSPQAKGRVERLWGTFQDRLVSELRLAGARTGTEAQQVLEGFLPQFNAQFAVPPAQPGTVYRPLPDGWSAETVLCFKYLRVVAADNTVQFGEHRLQIRPSRERTSYARVQVEVHERLDGSLAVYYHGQCLTTQAAPLTAPQLRARKGARPMLTTASAPGTAAAPAADVAGAVVPGDPATILRPAPGSPGGPPKPKVDHPWNRRGTLQSRTKPQTH